MSEQVEVASPRLDEREREVLRRTVDHVPDGRWHAALVESLAREDPAWARRRALRGTLVPLLTAVATVAGMVVAAGWALENGVELETLWAGLFTAISVTAIASQLVTERLRSRPSARRPDLLEVAEALAKLPGERWKRLSDPILGEDHDGPLAPQVGRALRLKPSGLERINPFAYRRARTWDERFALAVAIAERGSEEIRPLLDRAVELGNHHLARGDLVRILETIERASERRAGRASGRLVCPACRLPATWVTHRQPRQVSRAGDPIPLRARAFTCPACEVDRTLVDCENGVVVELGPGGGAPGEDASETGDRTGDDDGGKERWIEGGALHLTAATPRSCSALARVVFDRVTIAPGTADVDVEAFALSVLNEDDAERREALQRARVELAPGLELTENARVLLERTFASVGPPA